ncbi:MAG: hypothetical protein WDN44_07145 [Sphingomonas sp.]
MGRARAITGPYEWRNVLEPGTTPLLGPHQGGYVETPAGQGWFVHFNSTGAFGRIDYLEPVTWKDDWPVIGDPISGGTAGQPVATYATPAPRRRRPAAGFGRILRPRTPGSSGNGTTIPTIARGASPSAPASSA